VPPELAARTDGIVPWLLAEAQVIGPALGTVILIALLAAAMSTIDSVLLVAAGAIQRDIVPLFGRTDGSNSVGRARRIVFVCASLSLGLAIWARAYPTAGLGIVELTVFAGALYAGAFLPGLIGILYWRRASAQGAILGMVSGVATTAMWKFVAVPLQPPLAAFLWQAA
jgi:sodium/proline symporter